MALLNKRAAGFLAATLLGTTALHADVTAEDVWQSWSESYGALGYEIVVGAQDRSGDTLSLRDVVLTADMPEARTVFTIPELRLQEQRGKVAVSLADAMTAETTATADAESVTLRMTMRQRDFSALVSGVPDNLAYDIDAPEIVVEMDQVQSDGQAVPVTMQATVEGSKGTYLVVKDGGQKMTSDITTQGVRFTLSGADPTDGTTFTMQGNLADLALAGTVFVPEDTDVQTPEAAFAAGMNVAFDAEYGAASYAIDAQSPDGPLKIDSSVDSGAFAMTVAQDKLAYRAAGKGTDLAMTVPDLPFPVSLRLDEVLLNFDFPMAASETAMPFAAAVRVVGLSISEEIWGMFDPAAQLPRDPATLIVDLSGKIRPLVDLLSTEAAEASVPPAEIEALDINEVELTLAGAAFTGAGAITFDNSVGIPMPIGALDLRLVGANALMDRLVAMGLMPEDQVMFARMMLGLYAVPSGDDALTSKIEFKEGGEILANGQRIQ